MQSKTVLLAAAVFLQLGCGGTGGSTTALPGPVTPTNSLLVLAVSPQPMIVGSSKLVLEIKGSGFQATSVARWNGMEQPTSFVSETQLSATVAPSNLKNMGEVRLTVVNPSDNSSSNSLLITGSHSLSQFAHLQTARQFHTSTTFLDGKVLIAGGENVQLDPNCDPQMCVAYLTTVLSTTEVYDSTSKSFTNGPDLITPRHSHSATLLHDGRILITGGWDSSHGAVANTEIFDPETDTISQTATAPVAGGSFSFLLSDGRVLVFAGGTQQQPLVAQIYDPVSDSFSIAAQDERISNLQTATLLPNDKVLLIADRAAYLYDYATATFSLTNAMLVGRLRQNASFFVLNGAPKVIVIGGGDPITSAPLNSTEVFDIQTGKFDAGATMYSWRISSSSTIMADGSVLVIGGSWLTHGCDTGPADLWSPSANTFSIPAAAAYPGCGPELTRLPDGSVLITGGWSEKGESLASVWSFQ